LLVPAFLIIDSDLRATFLKARAAKKKCFFLLFFFSVSFLQKEKTLFF